MKTLGNKWIPFILTVIVVVLLNVASSTLFTRSDLTKNKAYSLSQASKDAVANLEEPLTIKAFLSKNLPAPYNNTEQLLRDLLEEYSIAGNRFFNYSIITMPSKEETASGKGLEQEDEAKKYRISPIQVQNVQQDEVTLQTVYMGMAFIHGDMIETIPAVTNAENLEYQLTGIVTRMGNKISALLGMDENIKVTLYLSANMEELGSSIINLPGQLREAIRDLNSQYYGKLVFDHLDPVATGAAQVLKNTYNVSPLTLRRRTDSGEITEEAYAALLISQGDKHYAQNIISRGIFGSQISDIATLKATIEDVAESLIGINEEIGYLADYGAPSLDGQTQSEAPIQPVMPDMQNFNALLSSEYSLRQIILKEEEIPEGLGCLIIAGPSERLSDYDLFKIDQFLMKGGSLAFFLDSHSIYIPQSSQYGQSQEPAYIPRNTGLEELLTHYGVTLEKGFVLDEASFVQQQRASNGGVVETPIYYAPIISEEYISDNLIFMSNIPELITLYSAPLTLSPDLAKGISASEVFSSSPAAWVMAEDINLMYPQLIQPPPPDMQETVSLAYVLDGTFTSYYAGRKAPEPEIAEQEEEPEATAGAVSSEDLNITQEVLEEGSGRIFVLGTSAILGSNVLDAEGRSGNGLFILNLFDYLNGREDNAIMRTKGVSYVPLKDTTPQLRSFIKTFNIAILPVLVVIAGLLVLAGRTARRKRLEFYFSGRKSGVAGGSADE
jgi:ABC-2 type transport system permease protein